MAKVYQDYADKVSRLVRDKSKQLDTDDAGDAIDSARLTYSRHKKKIAVQEYTGLGSSVRLYPMPTLWEDGLSDSEWNVEFPVDDTVAQVTYLDQSMCEVYNTPTGNQLRFRGTRSSNFVPDTTQKFRVHFLVSRQLNVTTNDIPDMHFLPVCFLAASELCLVMATRFAQQADQATSGGAAVADFRDKAEKFEALQTLYRDKYNEAILPKKDDIRAAFAFGEFMSRRF